MQRRASSWYGATMAPVGQAGMQAEQLPQCALAGGVRCQRQVGEHLADEEPRAGIARDQIGVLADPAEPGIARQRLLQHRRAVDEHPIAVRAGELGHGSCQPRAAPCASPCDSRGRARSAKHRRCSGSRNTASAVAGVAARGNSCARRSRAACQAAVRPGGCVCGRGAPYSASRRASRARASAADAARPRPARFR